MIEESRDFDRIRAVLAACGEHKAEVSEDCRYFLALRAGRPVGVLVADPAGDGRWIGHMQLGADSGGMASRYARQAAQILLREGAREVLGAIPANNHRSLRAAIGAGFRYISSHGGFHVMALGEG